MRAKSFIFDAMSLVSKIVRSLLVVVLIAESFTPALAWGWRSHHRNHTASAHLTARSALIWDVSHNRYYFSKNIEERVYPASTTKIMTVLLALEKLPLDQYVTVSLKAAGVPPTKLDFKPGEQYRVQDLIYACLLKSANDAAGVLAEAVAGSQEKFVEEMNQKAWALGARHTHFTNPHGLPSPGNQYTTAQDMAIIFKEALKYPFFQKVITFRCRIIYSKGGRRHFLKSHNRSLFLNWKQSVFGKTGYTRQAQSCFVGYVHKGNDVLIVDVFDTHRRWDYLKWMIERYAGVNL